MCRVVSALAKGGLVEWTRISLLVYRRQESSGPTSRESCDLEVEIRVRKVAVVLDRTVSDVGLSVRALAHTGEWELGGRR